MTCQKPSLQIPRSPSKKSRSFPVPPWRDGFEIRVHWCLLVVFQRNSGRWTFVVSCEPQKNAKSTQRARQVVEGNFPLRFLCVFAPWRFKRKAGLLPAPAAPPANLLKIPRKSSAAPPAKSTLPQKLNPPSTTIPRPRYFTASKNVLSTIFLLTDIGFLAIFKKFKEQTVAKNT